MAVKGIVLYGVLAGCIGLQLRAGLSPVSQLLKCKNQDKEREVRETLGTPVVPIAMEPPPISMEWNI